MTGRLFVSISLALVLTGALRAQTKSLLIEDMHGDHSTRFGEISLVKIYLSGDQTFIGGEQFLVNSVRTPAQRRSMRTAWSGDNWKRWQPVLVPTSASR